VWGRTGAETEMTTETVAFSNMAGADWGEDGLAWVWMTKGVDTYEFRQNSYEVEIEDEDEDEEKMEE
jgi:hypothetical protein